MHIAMLNMLQHIAMLNMLQHIAMLNMLQHIAMLNMLYLELFNFPHGCGTHAWRPSVYVRLLKTGKWNTRILVTMHLFSCLVLIFRRILNTD